MSRRIVILSVDHNPTYAWFVPLCSLMWRAVADYEVSCIFVGPVSPWLLDCARDAGTIVYECKTPPPCCGASSSAQIIRLFSYLLPDIEPEDYLLSVDADAWPLANRFAPSGQDLDLIYPRSADFAETPYFPIGYIGMRAKFWRHIIGIEGQSPEAGLEAMFRTDPTLIGGHSGWNYDETYITRKIKAWSGYPGHCHIVKREGDPPHDRLDRAGWPAHPDIGRMIDAHLLRPGWTDEYWPRLRPLLVRHLSPERVAWADIYRTEWVRRVQEYSR